MSEYDASTDMMYFSSDEKFEVEKPYITAFAVDDRSGTKSTNHEFEPHSMIIHDIRSHESFDLDEANFQYMKHSTSLSRENFDFSNMIENYYYFEINELVRKEFLQYFATAFLEYEMIENQSRSIEYILTQ